MLQDGSQLNLKSDILVLLVFYKLAAFVCEFHNHMDRVITEFNAVVLAFLTFIDNLTDLQKCLPAAQECVLHPIQKESEYDIREYP